MTLRQLMYRLRAEYGTWTAVSAKVGVKPQVLPTDLEKHGTYSFKVLLRIAEVAGESPTEVLRLGRKFEEAELLERLFAEPARPMSEEHREVLARYDQLPKPMKRALMTLLVHLTMHDDVG